MENLFGSGTKKEHKPKLLSPDIFRWGRGLPQECQRIAKGAGGKGPRQKTSKIVKKCQKVFRHFSTIFARHHFSGPFCNPLRMGGGQKVRYVPRNQGKQTCLAGYPGILPGYPRVARKVCEENVWVEFSSPSGSWKISFQLHKTTISESNSQ